MSVATLEDELRAAATSASSTGGSDLVAIAVGEVVSMCDEFLVCTGSSERQVGAIAEHVEEGVRECSGRSPISVEGADERRWVLLDYGDLVVHVFHKDERQVYRLEKLYADATTRHWDDHSGWTGGD